MNSIKIIQKKKINSLIHKNRSVYIPRMVPENKYEPNEFLTSNFLSSGVT